MSDAPIDVTIQAVSDEIGAKATPQLFYLLASLRSPVSMGQGRTPLNVTLVIDRSTSMRGERMNRVREAAVLVLDSLAPEDVISIVTFSDRAEVVVAARRVGNKHTVLSQLNRIKASGGTEMFQGLSAGAQELKRLTATNMVAHLILLTDGHTYGDSDQCLQLASRLANKRVGITAFGIGEDWNDQFLDQLVAISGGHSAYIATPAQILPELQSRIEGLGTVYAHNVRLKLSSPTGVKVADLFKVSPYAQPLPLVAEEVHLGAIEGVTPLTCLYEINIEPQSAGTRLMFDFLIQADVPTQVRSELQLRRGHTVQVTDAPAAPSPAPDVVQAVQLLNFYRMNEQAWLAAEEGQIELATRRMQLLTARLEEAGFTSLAATSKTEITRIAHGETVSLEGRKRMKYGTRALFTKKMDNV